MRAPSALRGPFLDARRTFSFASSATVPVIACLDLTRAGPALCCGLEDSCGRRKRRKIPSWLNIGMFMPASGYETLIRKWCENPL